MNRLLVLFSVALAAGCRTGTLPDPNNPADRRVTPEVLRKNLQAVSDSLIERRMKGEFDNAEYRDLLAKAATELVKEYNLKTIDPGDAWEYGEVLRAARNWSGAKEVLEIAVNDAKATRNEDRRVNDTLRLAEAMAHLGQVQESINIASEVLNARATDSAPILMAVFYEIAPVARGKSHDAELASLLEAAIDKHMATQVDVDTQAGRDFMAARAYHISAAYHLLTELYISLEDPKKAEQSKDRARRATLDIDGFSRDTRQRLGDGRTTPPLAGQSRL